MDFKDFSKDKSAFDFPALCKSLDNLDRLRFDDEAFRSDLLRLFLFCSETRIIDPFEYQQYATVFNSNKIKDPDIEDMVSILIDQGYTRCVSIIIAYLIHLYSIAKMTVVINSLLTSRKQTEYDTLNMLLFLIPFVLDKENLDRTPQHLVQIDLRKSEEKSSVDSL